MTETAIIPAPGLILLSEPFMADPHFKRTVVLLCEHSDDDGTVGFVLNRPLGMKVCDTLVDMDMVDSELFYGGPVAQDTMHYLHTYGSAVEDSLHIMDNIYWGGNFEQITEQLKLGILDPKQIKFFLGYSGWSPGQLGDELKENSWLTASGKGQYVFGIPEASLWSKILQDKGGRYAEVIHYPEDPSLN
ncbi:MAG: YqgE/AlgH family protein [Chitinophagales bacterium]|nr:YqgE/AlgH family protein [Chitinophagales bacterium]MCB9022331.1 YqgE/AlgH family protein [Chitinophagales bacterium]HPR28946.1 YqgE/AlgH family protein [Chitinophagales bacterium]